MTKQSFDENELRVRKLYFLQDQLSDMKTTYRNMKHNLKITNLLCLTNLLLWICLGVIVIFFHNIICIAAFIVVSVSTIYTTYQYFKARKFHDVLKTTEGYIEQYETEIKELKEEGTKNGLLDSKTNN